jgi:hypothetical protein
MCQNLAEFNGVGESVASCRGLSGNDSNKGRGGVDSDRRDL